MKRIYVVLISCLCAQACFSQTKEHSGSQPSRRLRLGFTAGTQVTHAKMQSSRYLYTEAAPDNLGWMAAMVGQLDIIDDLIVDASVGVRHDAVHTDGYGYIFGGVTSNLYWNYDFTWIENSVSLKYKFVNRPTFSLYAGFGIAADLLVKCKETFGVPNSYEVASWDATYPMRRLNGAVPIAAGIEFPLGDKKFGCTFSYHVGLWGVYKPVVPEYQSTQVLRQDGVYKMNTARISLAYMFSVSKQSSEK